MLRKGKWAVGIQTPGPVIKETMVLAKNIYKIMGHPRITGA